MINVKAKSVINLYKLLLEASDIFSDDYLWLAESCKSQGALAKVKKTGLGIIPMSLGTFKTYCNDYIEGGFEQVNIKRQKVISMYKRKEDKQNLKPKETIASLKNKLDQAHRARAVLMKAYHELNSITLDVMSENSAYKQNYKAHCELYANHFGLNLVIDNDEETTL